MRPADEMQDKPYILFESAELDENGIYISSDNVFAFPPHTHSYYEMTLYQPFDGVININGQNFDMNTKAPCVILINPSSFHKMSPPPKSVSRYIKVAFSQEILTLSPSKIPNWPIILTQPDPDCFLVRLFQELLTQQASPYYTALLINTAVCLLAEKGQKISPKAISGEHSLAMKAVRIINEHYDEHLSLNKVAELLSVSPPYLSCVFSGNIGMTFARYLCQLRLHHAARLLTDSDKTITDICYACGYRNLSHFLRSFKKQYGMTPKVYRSSSLKNCCIHPMLLL